VDSIFESVMLGWFLLTALALAFVAVDIRSIPESPVLKWGFLLLTAYTGVIGAFLYVVGCREPSPDRHQRFTAARWRQTLGSTMHCVAGDGIGILAGAVISGVLNLMGLAEIIVEYVLGFAFGWTIFQSLFMRDAAGGSYRRALASTLIPELLSMNFLMAGMVLTVMALRTRIESAGNPSTLRFWFVMSMGLLVGFIVAYPMNWWLVANHLKHGMMTVRVANGEAGSHSHGAHVEMQDAPHAAAQMSMDTPIAASKATRVPVWVMTLLSFLVLAVGVATALRLR
jgi:hypothetical protein